MTAKDDGDDRRDDRPLLSLQDAAARLGWTTRTLYARMDAGELGWVQLAPAGVRNARKIEPAELDRFIAERRRRVDTEEAA